MKTITLSVATGLLLMSLTGINISYAEQQVYGWQLMSEQERNEHQIKMRSFKTEQEREAYRLEHHKRMQERARKRGVDLPDRPPSMDKGFRGPGAGNRPGMGGGQRNR